MSWYDFLGFMTDDDDPTAFGRERQWQRENELNNLLREAQNIAIRDRQLWRMTTLIREALNEHKNKPGDKGSSQGQIRAVAEGIHNEIFRRFQGRFDVIDRALDRAERSKQDRDGWLVASLSPTLQKQYDLLIKMAAL